MDLQSPETLLKAWAIAPLVVVLASLGLGLGLSLVSGLRLEALTAPAGYLTGIGLMTFGVQVGLSGKLVTVICVVLAAAGPAALLWRRRAALRAWRPVGWQLWAAGGGLAAFAFGMAPLVGSGRSAVLGYVLNNDSVFHNVLVQELIDRRAETLSELSSYAMATGAFGGGYPIGAYVWPAFSGTLTGLDAIHVWSPTIAVTAGMTALVCFHLLRRLVAPGWFAGIAGAAVACGYLPYSYLAQGSGKEVLMALVLLATVALLAESLLSPLTWRSLIPAGIATAAGVADLGYPSLAFTGIAAGLFVAILALRAWRARNLRVLGPLLPYALLGAVVAAPSAQSSIDFIRGSRVVFANEHSIGNLLGDLPLRELLNVWLAGDYRFDKPELDVLTWFAAVVALAFAVLGLGHSAHRRNVALPMAVVASIGGSLAITPSVSIYFDAKTYLVIAPAIGLLTAAGVLWLSGTGLHGRIEAVIGGVGLIVGVLVSMGYVYTDVWNTPKGRFEELEQIAERIKEPGPLLVHEREDYAMLFMRDHEPFAEYGERPVVRTFRTPGGYPPDLPATPDFDQYGKDADGTDHIQSVRLLLERKRPGGSLPPSNFAPLFETERYRVWRREGPPPLEHFPLGLNRLNGAAALDCNSTAVRRVVRRARSEDLPIAVAFPGALPRVVVKPENWFVVDPGRVAPPLGQIVARRGYAGVKASVPPGRYEAWIQGSFGPVLRLSVDGRTINDIYGDIGLPDAWQRIGSVEATGRRQSFNLALLGRGWWFAGDRHSSLIGPLVLVPEGSAGRVERIPPERMREVCGKQVDWLEIPG